MDSATADAAGAPSTIDRVGKAGNKLSLAIHDAVLRGGEPTRIAADVLHGTWLGHPLHPVLTDVTIGAWTVGVLCDAIGALSGSRSARRMGDRLAEIGTAAAVPTTLAGLADFSTFPEWSENPATLHAAGNIAAIVLYLLSIRDRRAGHRTRGLITSAVAYTLSGASAWLGGELVYRHRVGVNQADHFDKVTKWTAVADEEDVPHRGTLCATADGKGVLLSRVGSRICAIGAKCGHAGGPLQEGTLKGHTIECPWHQSVFDLSDGRIVHGPATQPQPSLETRVRAGKVQVRGGT